MTQPEDPAAAWRRDFAAACKQIQREKLSLAEARRLLLPLAGRDGAPDEAYPSVSGAIRKLFPDYRDQDAQDPHGVVVTDPSGTGAEDSARAVLVRLSGVTPEKVSWLWPGRIPFGKITIVEGDPGLGKSLLALDLAARLTRGRPLPDGSSCEPESVVVLSAEDGLADTIRPRLDAAGADVTRVTAVTAIRAGDGEEMFPSLSRNVEEVEQAINETVARLLLIDPLMAYLGGQEVNSYKDQDVRRVLAPLAAMAERTGAAVFVVRHLTKSAGGQAIYRGGGSIGISAAARSVLLVARDPEDDSRRILAPVKSNLSKAPASLAYRIEENEVGVPWIAWEGAVAVTAGRLLAAQLEGEDERSARREAADALRELLVKEPKPEKEVCRELRSRGIAHRTYKRARQALGVQSHKDGFSGGWVLSLPEEGQRGPKEATKEGGPLRRVGGPLRGEALFEEGEI